MIPFMYLFNKTKLNKYRPFSSDIPNQLLTSMILMVTIKLSIKLTDKLSISKIKHEY